MRLSAAIFAVALTISGVFAQTLTTLYSFGDVSKQVGVRPAAPLLYAPDGLLYGTTREPFGASIVRGALFRIGFYGEGLTILKQFTNVLDGTMPQGRLVLQGDTLYGLNTSDGLLGGGTVYRVKTNGSGFSVLFSLPADSFPTRLFTVGGLTLGDSTLYGALPGGTSNHGTIFKINTDGTGYSVLKAFNGADGSKPRGDLVLSGSTLFGTTADGGGRLGTVFRIETDGSLFQILKLFDHLTF